MRERMLLEATDHVLRVELQRLRAELARLAGRRSQPCTPAASKDGLAGTLAELLQASRDAGRRLARLESAESARGALGAVLDELRRTREDLHALQGPAARRRLPTSKHPSAALFWGRRVRGGEEEPWGALTRSHTTSVSPCTLHKAPTFPTGLHKVFQEATAEESIFLK